MLGFVQLVVGFVDMPQWVVDAWRATLTAGFLGTVTGGAIGVLVGYAASELLEAISRRRVLKRVRAAVIHDVAENQRQAERIYAHLWDQNYSIIRGRNMLFMPEPFIADSGLRLLTEYPDALEKDEARTLGVYLGHLRTIQSCWKLYRATRAADLSYARGAGDTDHAVSDTQQLLSDSLERARNCPPRWTGLARIAECVDEP